jgi:hypothetical protein
MLKQAQQSLHHSWQIKQRLNMKTLQEKLDEAAKALEPILWEALNETEKSINENTTP